MITRQKLQEVAKQVRERKYGFNPGQQEVVRMLVDQSLILMDQLDGGHDAQERERQLSLALADLRTAVERLNVTANDSMHPEYGTKALFVLSMVEQMLRAKGPAWQREWAYYVPRIEEEFEADVVPGSEEDLIRRERL